MIDRGLLATIALVLTLVALLDRLLRRHSTDREPVLALATTPVMLGIAVGRLAAVLQDDPGTLRRPFDLLLVRGGMEFWPGLAAAITAVWVTARRRQTRPQEQLAELAPFALWAYGAYEAACLLRDGCFGPPFQAGLRPASIGEPQFPVGVIVGLAASVLGFVVWRWSGLLRSRGVIAVSVAGLAAIRAAAGFVLPKVSAGPTRVHLESISVLALSLLIGAVLLARSTLRSARTRRLTRGRFTARGELDPHGPFGMPASNLGTLPLPDERL